MRRYKSTNDRSSETKIEPERSTRFEKKKNMPRQCWGHDVVPLRADTTVVCWYSVTLYHFPHLTSKMLLRIQRVTKVITVPILKSKCCYQYKVVRKTVTFVTPGFAW